MDAALTYARRYALFTLVGIAGEDDLDAPASSRSSWQRRLRSRSPTTRLGRAGTRRLRLAVRGVPPRNRRHLLAALIALGDDLSLLLRGPRAAPTGPRKRLQPAHWLRLRIGRGSVVSG